MAVRITEVFLSEIDAYRIVNELERKITQGEAICNRDYIELIICPLALKGSINKTNMIRQVIGIISKLSNEAIRKDTLRGLLVFTDKVISKEESDRIRRMLTMTKVEQLIYNDFCKEKDKAVKDAKREKSDEIAINLIKSGDSLEKVASCTGIRLSRVEKLAAQIKVEA